VLGHLWPAIFWPATQAVFGFYILSGYLMTKILNEVYGISAHGMSTYFVNRFLRIYPAYWLVSLLSLACVALFPSAASSLNGALTVPNSLTAWGHNIFIFGLGDIISSGRDQIRLVPQAWALHIELFFYLLIPFIGSSRRRTTVWFLISIGYSLYLSLSGAPWVDRYRPALSASLPFSAGSLLYYLFGKPENPGMQSRLSQLLFPAAVLSSVNIICAPLFGEVQGIPFYLNILFSFAIILTLSAVPKGTVPDVVKRVDQFLGDLSYPIYLVHYFIAVLIVVFLRGGEATKDVRLFLVALPFVNGAAIMIHISLKRINVIRDCVRGKKLVS